MYEKVILTDCKSYRIWGCSVHKNSDISFLSTYILYSFSFSKTTFFFFFFFLAGNVEICIQICHHIFIFYVGLYLWQHIFGGHLEPADVTAQWREGSQEAGKTHFRYQLPKLTSLQLINFCFPMQNLLMSMVRCRGT